MKLLLTVAHPDDEAFGCGSVLAHAAASGVEATVVCATRGELGEPAPGSGLEPDVDPVELGRVREAELRDACALLGVARVEVLDLLDSGMDGDPAPGSLAAADPAMVSETLMALIDEIRPDVVVTIGRDDVHRDHVAIGAATLLAVVRSEHRPSRTYVWTMGQDLIRRFVGVDGPEFGTPLDLTTTVVDVSRHRELREQAIRAHASQVPPFDSMSPDLRTEFLEVDRLCRVHPPWTGGPKEDDWVPRD